jgi:hypothetical protein
MPAPSRLLPGLLAALLLTTCSALEPRQLEQPAPAHPSIERTPLVFVSGMTGTKLLDPATGTLVWGGARQLLAPRDGGRNIALPLAIDSHSGPESLFPQSAFEPAGPVWTIRLLGWTKQVYQPLRERLEEAGYRLGDLQNPRPVDSLFFFDYDWRYGNLFSVRQLDNLLSQLSKGRGGVAVDLVCQSNAAKICRWLAKYGSLGLDEAEAGVDWQRNYRIRSLVLAGVSNGGSLRVFKFLDRGRTYIPLVGRRLLPELFFTLRPLFEDLPADRDDLFFDESGQTVDADLFDPGNWLAYGWSIFSRRATARLSRRPSPGLLGEREDQLDYLGRQLSHSRRLQRLLATDSASFPDIRYYLIENDSQSTIDRALLTRVDGEWRVFFAGDRQVERNPELRKLAVARGDGHAVLASQRALSPQEADSLSGTAKVEGDHFEAIITPEALDAIVGFLSGDR